MNAKRNEQWSSMWRRPRGATGREPGLQSSARERQHVSSFIRAATSLEKHGDTTTDAFNPPGWFQGFLFAAVTNVDLMNPRAKLEKKSKYFSETQQS